MRNVGHLMPTSPLIMAHRHKVSGFGVHCLSCSRSSVFYDGIGNMEIVPRRRFWCRVAAMLMPGGALKMIHN